MSISQVNILPVGQTLFTDTNMTFVVDAISASGCKVFSIRVDNSLNSAVSYIELYNVAGGNVTAGTTPADLVVMVPANSILRQSFSTKSVAGLTFGTALSAACFVTSNGNTPCAPVSPVVVSIRYA